MKLFALSIAFLTTLLTAVLATSAAQALPLPKHNLQSVVIPETFTADYDFEGIVGLNNCSGSIIQLENAKDADKALVLTNGHCFEGGFAAPDQFTVNKPSSRPFNVLNSSGDFIGRVTATTVLYSTMTATDITLYQLKETYDDIKTKFNVRPLTLSSKHPELQMPIEVISGFWKKGYTCGIEKFIDVLKEDKWTMKDSIRYSRPGCETIGGTSGSPIILAGTRQVVGINNTGNEDGEKCTMNNPCEIDAAGNLTFVKGYSYGQETYWIYSCLNSNQQFDIHAEGCQLPH